MEQVFKLIGEALDNSEDSKELILLDARWNTLKTARAAGTISGTDALLEENQIRASLLDLI